jgi:hypothetical protein
MEMDVCIRRVNSILRRNRKILVELNPEGKNKVNAEKLRRKGFDFNFFTHVTPTSAGKPYYYCYDQGYFPTETGHYVLVTDKELMQ